MGVKKEHDAPMAVAMRNGSTCTFRVCAKLIAMGAITTVVAALFMKSDRDMVTIINTVSVRMGEMCEVGCNTPWAISVVPPVVCNAVPIGIIAASKILTGQSMLSY